MCSVRIWELTAVMSLYSCKWLGFITETENACCAVRTETVCAIQVILEFGRYGNWIFMIMLTKAGRWYLSLTLLWHHGVYVTPVLFDSLFFLWNCHEYLHRLLRIFFRKALLMMSHTFANFCLFPFFLFMFISDWWQIDPTVPSM
jgi:hypothetical protein